jgi:hypothetical protein
MLKGVLTVGGWTMVSRILGFARDMLIAAVLGIIAGLAAESLLPGESVKPIAEATPAHVENLP